MEDWKHTTVLKKTCVYKKVHKTCYFCGSKMFILGVYENINKQPGLLVSYDKVKRKITGHSPTFSNS